LSKAEQLDNGKETAMGRDTPGFIKANALYTLAEFQQRLGLGRAAYRQARRDGLPVIKIGRCFYIAGQAAMEWASSREAKHAC
jgi:hypothetical protein